MRILLIIGLMVLSQFAFSQILSEDDLSILKQEFEKKEVVIKPLVISPDNFNPQQVKGLWEIYYLDEMVSYLLKINTKGRMHSFTSLVLLNSDGALLQVRIIEYPSTHGIQVTNKRWLGKLRIGADSPLKYGKNVDALSGATISANGLIDGIELVREGVKRMSMQKP